MAGLSREGLRFSRLTIQTQILQPTLVQSVVLPGQVPQPPQALTSDSVARIYAGIAKHGFTSMQQVPGGAQMATGDGVSVVLVTANSFQFSEDLTRSAWQQALERLSVTVEVYAHEVAPQSFILQEVVDLQGIWENLGQGADAYIAHRFLKPGVEKLVEDFGFSYNGGAIRLNLVRPVTASVPPGLTVIGPQGIHDALDVRLEPLFMDKSKLFIQVTATFTPTQDMKEIAKRAEIVHEVTWNRLARNIALEATD